MGFRPKKCTCKKVVLFGGAFDPPHRAHLALAASARKILPDATILWIPTASPPHNKAPSADFTSRLRMVGLLTRGKKNQFVCDLERNLSAPSYSLNSLLRLQELMPKVLQWYLLMGSDSLMIFKSWYGWQKILKKARLLVFRRPGFASSVPKGFPSGSILWAEGNPDSISSSLMRKYLKSGQGQEILAPSVHKWIQEKGLYGQKIQ